jgi:hypothetical protein
MTIGYMSYILIVFTYRGHVCERACASERVIKCSLIYGRFLFTFAVNILQITKSSMFTHRAPACEHACVSARVVKHSLILGRIVFKFAGHIPQMTTSYMGYILIMFTHRGHARKRACASARVINCLLTYGRFFFKFAVKILQITIRSKGYVLFMCMHACEGACARARVRAHAWLSVRSFLNGLSPNLVGTYNVSPEIT